MATVPKIDIGNLTQVRDIGNTYQSAEGATPDAFGAGIGRSLVSFGNAVGQAGNQWAATALKAQQENNIAQAKELDTEAMRRVRVESYGGLLDESDPGSLRKGYYNLNNQEALAETGNFQAAVRKHYDDVFKTAPTDAVKLLLRDQFERSVGAEIEASFKFHDQQNKNWQRIVEAARLDEAQQGGILGDEQKFLDARAVVVGEVQASAKSAGIFDRAYIANQVQSAITTMAVKRVHRLMNEGKFEEAYKFFKERVAAKDIDEDEAVDLMAKLETGVTLSQAYKAADELIGPMGKNIINDDGSLDSKKLKNAYEKAKSYPDKQRKLIISKIDEAVTRHKTIKKLGIADALSKGIAAVSGANGLPFSEWVTKNPTLVQVLAGDTRALSLIQSVSKKSQLGKLFSDTPTGAGDTVLGLDHSKFADATLEQNTLTVDGITYSSTQFTQQEWNKIPTKMATGKNKQITQDAKDTVYNRIPVEVGRIAPKRYADGGKVGASEPKKKRFNSVVKAVEEWATEYYANSNNKKWPGTVEIRQQIREMFLTAGVDDDDISNYWLGADNIRFHRGALLKYNKMDEDQKSNVEVDLEEARGVFEQETIDALYGFVDGGAGGNEKAREYINTYGKDRFVAHILALAVVGDDRRAKTYGVDF